MVPITRIGGAPVTVTSPSLSPFAGFGMPSAARGAQPPPHGGSCGLEPLDVGELGGGARAAFGSGRSTQLITELASSAEVVRAVGAAAEVVVGELEHRAPRRCAAAARESAARIGHPRELVVEHRDHRGLEAGSR